MPSYTQRYHLEKLANGEPFSSDGQKYTLADRDTIDRVMQVGAETHHHTGVNAASQNPTTPPSLSQSLTGGTLPASKTAYYEYTWVDPNGFETAPSPAASVTLPSPISTPGAPTLGTAVGGTLPAGTYRYLVTAYVGSSTSETLASLSASITTSSTGSIVVNFPTLPSGASGFNIYRFPPGGSAFLFMATVPVTGGTPTSWTDNGSVGANCNRFPPSSNTTNSTNSVVVTLPVSIPTGFTWNLYRSYSSTDWTSTLIASITTGGTSYTDVGATAQSYAPPASSMLLSTPPKVLLTNGAEVQGQLPASMVDMASSPSVPFAVTFNFGGYLSPTTGISTWRCPFGSATIVSAACSLGRGSVPASQPVIADVLKGTGVNPSYVSIYSGATPNPKPQVPVGHQVGAAAPPNITTLAVGDTLSVDIDQSGGGATPTDHDLTITVYLLVTNT